MKFIPSFLNSKKVQNSGEKNLRVIKISSASIEKTSFSKNLFAFALDPKKNEKPFPIY